MIQLESGRATFFCEVRMKKIWSPKWVASTQPRKQRKYRHNAPLHVRRKFLSAHLSGELRKEFGKRSVPLRKGDEVIVMKGGFRGFKGSVERVDMSSSRVYVDGMKRKKVDGSETAVPVHASNVMITKLTLEDKMRQAVFERAGPRAGKPAKASAEKPKAQKRPKKGKEGE
jgi:large subunit ribosomal protein L24